MKYVLLISSMYVTLQKNGKNSTRIRDKHSKIVNSAQI